MIYSVFAFSIIVWGWGCEFVGESDSKQGHETRFDPRLKGSSSDMFRISVFMAGYSAVLLPT